MISPIRNPFRFVRTYGLGRTFKMGCHKLYDTYCERKLRVQTMGYVSGRQLGISDAQCHDYAPTFYWELRRLMKRVDTDPAETVFLDLGSGKGRVVIMAALFPFKKVIGVEISAELSEIAARNIRSARSQLRASEIELVTADASQYSIPDEVNVIFLYNPFSGRVLGQVFENIRASLMAAPRDITVVYYNPERRCESMLLSMDWLKVKDEFRGFYRHLIFRAQPPVAVASR